MKPSEILDKAADIIVRDGWIQGTYYLTPQAVIEGCDSDLPEEEWSRLNVLDLEANKSAPCCQAGAIMRATIGYAWNPVGDERVRDPEAAAARRKADGYMGDQVGHHGGKVWSSAVAWNDAGERTAEEVVEALRGAAEQARRAGE